MKAKKISADWYVAATHWITAGFVIPFLSALVIGIPLTLILGKDNLLVLSVGFWLLTMLSVWLGALYSAKYLNKTYVIKNAHKIVVLSTIYLTIIGGGFRLLRLIQTGTLSYEILGFIISIVVFYIVSKKYIKNS